MSRRNFLTAAGIVGAGTLATCTCGGLIGGLWLLAQNAESENSTAVIITATSDDQTAPTVDIGRPTIISREEWGALPPDHTSPNENGFYDLENPDGWRVYDTPLEEAYQTVVIHHSAVWRGDDINTLLEVQSTHRGKRGWADVAYHYLIGKGGTIYEGRDIHVRGTHVENYNTGSVGVCLLGNFMREIPTDAQISTTHTVVQWLAGGLQLTHLAAHRIFNPQTECPGDYLTPYMDAFANNAGLVVGTEGYIPPPGEAAETAFLCPWCDNHA